MAKKSYEVPVKQLRWRCDPKSLGIKTTEDVKPSKEIIGQHRALGALELGLKMPHHGYNVFVTGFSGTGRMTAVKQMLQDFENQSAQLHDHCFVYNFKNHDVPVALRLRAGEGKLFQKKMEEFIKDVRKNLPALFESHRFQEERKRTFEHFQERQRSVLKEFEKIVHARGFEVVQVQVGETMQPDVVPVIEGQPTGFDQLEQFVKEEKITADDVEKIWHERSQLESQIQVITREMRNIERKARETLNEQKAKYGLPLIKDLLDEIRKKLEGEKVATYLNDVQEEIMSDLDRFTRHDDAPPQMAGGSQIVEDNFYEFQVNVVVDNSRTKGMPIIIETNPRFHNLFGSIDREIDRNGTWQTDFTLIKGGSLLHSDGGFLVLNAMDVLMEPGVWHTLKTTLLNERLEIQSMESGVWGMSSTIKPEPISVNVKIILVGDVDIYYYLFHQDDEFKKIFKVRSDFDTVILRSLSNLKKYTAFIGMISKEEKLLSFDKTAVAEVLEEGARLAGNQKKLTSRFNIIGDILRESNFWALKEKASVVTSANVRRAIKERNFRESLIEEKIREEIEEGMLLIDTQGRKIGQLNGLSVYELAGYGFGLPTRITATTAMGKQGIINIEREASMSGPSHNKGMLIVSGYFSEQFAQDKPLS
ncbi:MAG: ATP-binding protein, partial [Bacteroidota bacterium]